MSTKHKWVFRARFRANAYSWKGTRLASQRMREAVSEIKKVRRKDPVLAAEGVVLLVERLWPALQRIDSSSGALGSAVVKTLEALLPILIEAPADRRTRERWLDRLWQDGRRRPGPLPAHGEDLRETLVSHFPAEAIPSRSTCQAETADPSSPS